MNKHCKLNLFMFYRSIEEPYMGRTQHHRKFFNILSGFRLTLEDLGKCPQLKAESGIFEMTSEESIKWLRNLAEEYDDVDTKNCFLVMVEICEQMKHGIDSSCFNCNNYEHYLRLESCVRWQISLVAKKQKSKLNGVIFYPLIFLYHLILSAELKAKKLKSKENGIVYLSTGPTKRQRSITGIV